MRAEIVTNWDKWAHKHVDHAIHLQPPRLHQLGWEEPEQLLQLPLHDVSLPGACDVKPLWLLLLIIPYTRLYIYSWPGPQDYEEILNLKPILTIFKLVKTLNMLTTIPLICSSIIYQSSKTPFQPIPIQHMPHATLLHPNKGYPKDTHLQLDKTILKTNYR